MKKAIFGETFDDGKTIKKGIISLFFAIQFLAKCRDKGLNIVKEFTKIYEYLKEAERRNCEFCIANIDHQAPNFSLTSKESEEKRKKESLLDSVITSPLLLEEVISRIEYQAIFLLIIKKEQETYFQKQIEMLEDGI